MEDTTILLNGTETRLLRSGDTGPAVLMLHGFPEHAGAWRAIAQRLPDLRCYAPDQRGYGRSYRPSDVAEYAAGKLVRDMLGLIDRLELDRVHVVGHDWGASVAYGLAFTRDPRLASLTVINGVHPVPFQRALATGGAQCAASQYITWLRRDGTEDVLAADGFSKLATLFAEGMDMAWMTRDVLDEYRAVWGDRETLRAMINWYRASPLVVGLPGAPLPADALPVFPQDRMRVEVPHQVIWGVGDKALLPESRSGLEAFCNELEIHEIADADHWVCHQNPDRVAALIGAFIRKVDAF